MFDEHARHEKVEYNVSNPHPLLGKDPNIMNEFGHTHYPKWIDHPTEKRVDHVVSHYKNGETTTHVHETKFPARVLVESAEHEAEVTRQKVKGW